MSEPADLPGYKFLGWGPKATSQGLEWVGWHLATDYFGQCGNCGDLLRLWNDQSEHCSCGRLHKDVDAGRFGSRDGDNSFAVYRKLT